MSAASLATKAMCCLLLRSNLKTSAGTSNSTCAVCSPRALACARARSSYSGCAKPAAKEWDAEAVQPLRVRGLVNFLWLLGVVAAVIWVHDKCPIPFLRHPFMREVVMLVMRFAPIGVFCLMGKTFAEQGIGLIIPMIGYFLVVVSCLLIHSLGVYSTLLLVFARVNPWIFFKKMRSAQVFAFSTASSNATIPVTLKTVEQQLGVNRSTAAFTVPLGATVNMDGTAIMQGVATVFIANVYGIEPFFEKLVDGFIFANIAIENKLDSGIFQILYAVLNHIFGEFEIRDSVNQEAASFRFRLENGDGVSLAD
jgi:hypothetical protein